QEKQIVYMWRKKGMKIVEQAKEIARISRDFDNPYFLVEQNNIGIDLLDELIDTWNVNVEGFVTGGVGQKKEELILFLVQAFEREQISMPQGDEHSRQMMYIVEEELAKFRTTRTPAGKEKFEGVGAHDDCVMALALLNRATQHVSVPFAVASGEALSAGVNPYENIVQRTDKHESELVNMIRLGLIK
ncbi:unnamed protein product, partial [marine sediment metagenome]